MMTDAPLHGVTVLDMSTILAGPLASSLLGEFGAEVIKIEEPRRGDPARSYPPMVDEVSAQWAVLGRNKRSVTVDLHQPGAAEVVGRLAAAVDIVVTNFRPGTLRRFGVDFDDLLAFNPGLVMVHVSAFGRTGPYAERPGFARVAEAFAGLTHRTGEPDRPPIFAGYPVADGVTGIYAAFAAMLALRQHEATGEPQLVDLALYEPLLRMMEDFLVDYDVTGHSIGRQGNENPHISPNNLYRTRDGRWLALPASTDQMWRRLVKVMGVDELAGYTDMAQRVAHRQEIESRVHDFVASYDLDPLMEILVDAGIAAGPVNSAEQIFADPHIRARGSVVEFPDGSGRRRRMQSPAGVFSGFAGSLRSPAPALGEHTDAVLADLAGLTADEIRALHAKGVI